MAAPTSAIWKDISRGQRTLTISAQTASFDLPFSVFGLFGLTIQLAGTIGSAATSLQVANDNTNFIDVALLQTTTVGHTELKALTIALSPYSLRREDAAYPYFNLHHTAGGGSSIAFTLAMTFLRG